MHRGTLSGLSVAAVLLLFGRTALGQFEELAHWIPSSANCVALVNMEKILASEFAKTEDLTKKRETLYSTGATFLPADASRAILASQLDFHEWVPLWETAIIEVAHEVNMPTLARLSGGQLDQIGSLDAVALPNDSYVLRLGDHVGGAMAPANRQAASRWVRECASRDSANLSPYLNEALGFVDKIGTPIVLALDLEDVVTADGIQTRLASASAADFVKKYKLDVDQTAQELAGLRGVMLGITFRDQAFGKVKVDFRDEVSLPAEAAKAVILHLMAEHGATIVEMDDWKANANGKQITLEGYLGESGLRRISSLFNKPPALKESRSPEEYNSLTEEQKTVEASQTYFKGIEDMFNDLKDEKRQKPGYTIGQLGKWCDKYADKIDQLSVVNVDAELVDYGAMASNLLRGAYQSLRTGAGEKRVQTLNAGQSYGDYGYGYTYRHERTRVQAQSRIQSVQSANSSIDQLKVATGDIRRKMSQKYGVDF